MRIITKTHTVPCTTSTTPINTTNTVCPVGTARAPGVPRDDGTDPTPALGEDALWPPGDRDLLCRFFTTAIADGAGGSYNAGPWAAGVARAACHGALHRPDRLRSLRTAWAEASRPTPSCPWWVQAAFENGAAATCLRLTLGHRNRHDPGGAYRVDAIGDTCLVHMRGDTLIASWPYTRPESFQQRPTAVHTDPAGDAHLPALIQRLQQRWYHGDCLFLMTDALACWFLRRHLAGYAPWRVLLGIGRRSQDPRFAEWVRRQQHRGAIADDDVTLRIVTVLHA